MLSKDISKLAYKNGMINRQDAYYYHYIIPNLKNWDSSKRLLVNVFYYTCNRNFISKHGEWNSAKHGQYSTSQSVKDWKWRKIQTSRCSFTNANANAQRQETFLFLFFWMSVFETFSSISLLAIKSMIFPWIKKYFYYKWSS